MKTKPSAWNISLLLLFVGLIYFTFAKSLNLPLWGDDWVMLWIAKNYYGPGHVFPYLSLKGYSQPWGVMNLILLINNHFFGFSGFGYYLVSMILRTFSALAAYIFITKFNNSKIIGLVGGLFVLVGYAGIESTNYTIHMNTYLVPLLMFISLTFLISSFKGKYTKFLLGCVFFALSLASSPLRSHGLLPFVLLFDILYGVYVMKTGRVEIIFRQIFLFLSFLLIYKLRFFGAPNFNFINFVLIGQMIKNGDFTFFTAFITNLGRVFFPDMYLTNLGVAIHNVDLYRFKGLVLTAFVIESLIFWQLSRLTHQKIKNYVVSFVILLLNFLAVIFLNKTSFLAGPFPALFSTFIGLFFLSFSFWGIYMLFSKYKDDFNASWIGIIVGPILVLTALAVPLLSNLGSVYDTNHRYLTLSMSGVAITLSSILKFSLQNKKLAVYFSIFLISLLLVNIRADRDYFKNLYVIRNPDIARNEWDLFTRSMNGHFQKYPDKLLLFYIDESESGGIAGNTLLYGFNLRTALQYNINDQNKIPALTTVYGEVISAVTDGKAFLRLGYKPEKININQVYAFKILKNGDLVEITESTRKKVTAAVNK